MIEEIQDPETEPKRPPREVTPFQHITGASHPINKDMRPGVTHVKDREVQTFDQSNESGDPVVIPEGDAKPEVDEPPAPTVPLENEPPAKGAEPKAAPPD